MTELEAAHRLIPNGVFVITAVSEGSSNGCTAAWVTRVSYRPVLVGVSLYVSHLTTELVEKSGVFGIHILDRSQIGLARHFGLKSGRTCDKMDGIPHSISPRTGLPLLRDCLGRMECKVVEAHSTGDHRLFVGEIVHEETLGNSPGLIYNHSDYEELDLEG